MIDFGRLHSQYYSEPFKPYFHPVTCHQCLEESHELVKYKAEGKEGDNFILYYRLICPVNPAHSKLEWERYARRPWKFRMKKRLRRLLRLDNH